jgi:hypothetical protein
MAADTLEYGKPLVSTTRATWPALLEWPGWSLPGLVTNLASIIREGKFKWL